MFNKPYNKTNTEKCVEMFLNALKNDGIRCERVPVPKSAKVYPNLIHVYSQRRAEPQTWQVVCSENPNPQWLAIPSDKKYDKVSLYVAYAPDGKGDFVLRGYALPDELKLLPPHPPSGWENETYRSESVTQVFRLSYIVDNLERFKDFVNWCESMQDRGERR